MIHNLLIRTTAITMTLFAVCSPCEAKTKVARVSVHSFAQDAYLKQKEQEIEPKKETFLFHEGKFFGGNIRDKSLTEVSIEELVQNLEKELAYRNYFPATDIETANLLIVVHRGVTSIEPTLDELMGETTIGSPESDEEEAGEDIHFEEGVRKDWKNATANSNASLIGYDKELKKRGLMSDDAYRLEYELTEERYFIILMAYDFQKIRAEQKLELLWSSRFSVKATGTDFHAALPALTRAARDYYGSNLNGIARTRTYLGPGEINIGELEVIETLEENEED